MTIARNVGFSEVVVNHVIIKLCYFREKLEQETLCSQKIDSQSPFFVSLPDNCAYEPVEAYATAWRVSLLPSSRWLSAGTGTAQACRIIDEERADRR